MNPVGAAHPAPPGRRRLNGVETFHADETHPFLGGDRLTYEASLMDNVVVLPEHPLVTGVNCTSTTLTLALSDAGAAESWVADYTIMASAVAPWWCPDPVTGEVGPFVRKIVAVREVHVAPRVVGAPAFHYDAHADSDDGFTYQLAFGGRSATVTYDTVDVPAQHAFKHLDMSFTRTPPRALTMLADIHAENATLAREVRVAVDEMLRDPVAFSSNGTVPLQTALARRLGLSEHHERRLFWGWISDAVSAVVSVVKAVGNIASALVNDGKWELDGSKKYTLVDWEQDDDYFNENGARLWCDDCKAYLGGGLTAVAKFKWATLQSAELTVGGGAVFKFGLKGTFNNRGCFQRYIQKRSASRSVGSFTITVFAIPIRFILTSSLVAEVLVRATGTASFSTHSFDFSGNARMGVEYVSGWRTVRELTSSRSVTGPSYAVRGAVQVLIIPHAELRISIWGVWDHMIRLSPFLSFRAMNVVTDGSCVPAMTSDASNVGSCRNKVWADVSLGVSASYTMGRLGLSVTLLGFTLTLEVPGLPLEFSIPLINPVVLAQTCLPMASSSGRLLQAATSCASEGCAYTAGNWTACPVSCGAGRQTRLIGCVDGSGFALDLARCAATPGLTAPAESQECEVACPATGYLFGSRGNFSDSPAPFALPTGGIVLGVRIGFNRRYTLTFIAPSFIAGGKPSLFAGCISVPPSDGDADVELRLPFRRATTFVYGPTSDSLIADGGWGLEAGSRGEYILKSYDPVDALAELGYTAMSANATDLHAKLLPFVDLTAEDQLATFNMSGTPEVPDVRYFRFRPALGAVGVFFALHALKGSPDVVSVRASLLADQPSHDWPLWQDMAWSSERTPPRRSIAATTKYRSLSIADGDFKDGSYAIAVVATGTVTVDMTTTDILPVAAGAVQRYRLAGNALRMFRYESRTTDSLLFIQATALTGDPDLFVSRRPWSRPPSYQATETDAQWTAAKDGSETMTIWDTDPAFGNVWYIAVTSYLSASDMRIAVQSYEVLEQGVPVTRLQLPSTYSYFLGSSRPPLAEQLAGPELVPGTNVSLYDSGLSFFARLRGSSDSIASLDMLVGGQARFWPAVSNGREGMAVRGLLASSPAAELSRGYLDGSDIARPLIMSVLTGHSGVTASDRTTNAENDRRRLVDDGVPSKATKTVTVQREDGLTVELPDLTSEELVDAPLGQAPAPAASSDNVPNDAGARLLQLTPAAVPDSAIMSLLDVRLLDSAPRPGPTVLIQSPSAGVWATLSNCTLSNAAISTRCTQVSRPGASVVMLRVRVPARTSVSITIAPTAGRTDGVVDTPYTFTVSSDDVPTGDGDGALAVATAAISDASTQPNAPFTGTVMSLPLDNCRFVARDVFVAVAGNNNPPEGRPIAFDVVLTGESADNGICPSTSWYAGPWGACSAVCGAGVRRRVVTCTLAGGLAVGDSLCNAAIRPAASEACDSGVCSWTPLEWSDCTSSCGGGSLLRLLECRNGGGRGVVVLDRHCDGLPQPITSLPCNMEPCPTLYWDVSPWAACSVKCGGGYQARTVACRLLGDPADQAVWKCQSLNSVLGPMPPIERECGRAACAPSGFQLLYFDARALASGRTRRDVLAPQSRAFYTFSPPAGARGMCLRVETALPQTQVCSSGIHALALQCRSQLGACVAAAMQNATTSNATVAADTYEPFEHWGEASQSVPPAACDCFPAAQRCLAQLPPCFTSLANSIHTLSQLASGCPAAEPATSVAASLPLQPVRVFGSRYNGARDVTGAAEPFTFMPPTEAAEALNMWPTFRTPSTSAHWVVDWDPVTYASSRDPIMIGIVSGASAAVLNVTATALTELPVAVGGTAFAAASVSAAAVRAGGLTLSFTLSCDRFALPLSVLATLPGMNLTTAQRATMGGRLTYNFIAAGFMAQRSVAGGWNRVARSVLLDPATTSFASVSPDGVTATITLPAMPAYSPTVDETVALTLPFAVLASGRSLPLATTLRIATDRPECVVSGWSSWTPCSATCARGTQSRTRTITSQAASGAAGCPELVQTRSCDTCNPCEGVTCANGGLCTAGSCLCPPGYAGRLCDAPAAPAVIAFWTVSDWSACSATCGDNGAQARTGLCSIREGLVTRAALNTTECVVLGAAAPALQRGCNQFPCNSTERPVQLVLQSSVPLERITASSASRERFEQTLVTELSGAATVHAARVLVESIRSGTAAARMLQATTAAPALVTVTVLPSTATINATGAGGVGVPVGSAMTALSSGTTRSSGSVLSTVSWSSSTVPQVAGFGATSTTSTAPADQTVSVAVLGGAVAGALVLGLIIAGVVGYVIRGRRRGSPITSSPQGGAPPAGTGDHTMYVAARPPPASGASPTVPVAALPVRTAAVAPAPAHTGEKVASDGAVVVS